MKTIAFAAQPGGPGKLFVSEPAGEPRALVLILHGMAEHYGRYDRLAEALSRAGYAAGGYDQRGHGAGTEKAGSFGGTGGWQALVDDVAVAANAFRGLFPGKKLVVFGHSMGSFIAREHAIRHGKEISGLVLSGTGWWSGALCTLGRLMAVAAGAFDRQELPSPLMNWIVFSRNNRPFKRSGARFAWLSRDQGEVAAYADDPLCGFPLTAAAYRDFFNGLLCLTDLRRLGSIPPSLPVYLFSGEEDPVGARGQGVRTVKKQYTDAGLENVTLRLYPGARHEMLHELNRDEAIEDLVSWLGSAISAPRTQEQEARQ